MKELNNFRIISEFEKSIIIKSLSKISLKSETILMKIQDKLYISFDTFFPKNKNPSIYLLSKLHIKLLEKLKRNLPITSAGLYFGYFKKDNFRLSLEGVEFLLNKDYLSKEQILTIDNDGEKSVLYGNDIFKDNIIKFPKKYRDGDLLIISNSKNEICAIAYSLIDQNNIKKIGSQDKFALNLVDKGYYLRSDQ